MAYRSLSSSQIITTLERLTQRIDERFPGAGLSAVGKELLALGRYLDYCSEMLSLANKVAALFVQRMNDPQVLAAVDEVSGLTNGLSSKIWQKLTILDAEMQARRGRLAGGV